MEEKAPLPGHRHHGSEHHLRHRLAGGYGSNLAAFNIVRMTVINIDTIVIAVQTILIYSLYSFSLSIRSRCFKYLSSPILAALTGKLHTPGIITCIGDKTILPQHEDHIVSQHPVIF